MTKKTEVYDIASSQPSNIKENRLKKDSDPTYTPDWEDDTEDNSDDEEEDNDEWDSDEESTEEDGEDEDQDNDKNSEMSDSEDEESSKHSSCKKTGFMSPPNIIIIQQPNKRPTRAAAKNPLGIQNKTIDKAKKKPVLVKTIKNPEYKNYSEEERKYYKHMPMLDQELISGVETRMKELNQDNIPIRFKVLLSNIDEKIKAAAVQKLNHLYNLDPSTNEYHKILHWIESVCKIPFNKYQELPVSSASPKQDIRDFLLSVQERMDTLVYGHKDAKEHIVRLLAQWIAKPDAKGMILGIHGPAGCGKTMMVKDSICAALGLPFAFIPLGGANDGCYLEGHSYTYEGAIWGKIIDVLMKSKCMNPVLFFDELDKVSETNKGEEIINILIHLTDQTQNDRFTDKYFSEFEFDLSRCLIIFSYNDESRINPILRDRLTKIHTNGYSVTDKVLISTKHMIPTILEEYNFKKDDIVFSDDIVKQVIQKVEDEQGVRNLRRGLVDVISNINLVKMLELDAITLPYHIQDTDVKKFIYLNTSKDMNKTSLQMMYI